MNNAALFAVCSAFLYAMTQVITRVGLKHAETFTAVWVSLLSCMVCSLVLGFFYLDASQLFSIGTLLFLLAGIVGPLVGRMFLYEGIKRTGVSIASALYQVQPLYAALSAVFILGEPLTLTVAAGLLLMMTGAVIISSDEKGVPRGRAFRKIYLSYPLIAGLCYGTAHILRKMGMNFLPEPVTGVVLQNVGVVLLLPFLFFVQKNRCSCSLSLKPGILFIIAGILQILAQWSLLLALQYGQVVVVIPLSSLTVLFVLILSTIFLKQLERVTMKMVVGALLIVFATFLLIL